MALIQGELLYSIGNLKSLSCLDVSYCSFSRKITPSIGNCIELSQLAIFGNNFFFPKFLFIVMECKFEKLTVFVLLDSNIPGKISFVLMNLMKLSWLYLYNNQLIDPIPSCLMNLNKLSHMF